jgi:hypothetical protein
VLATKAAGKYYRGHVYKWLLLPLLLQVSLREGSTQPPPLLFERDLIAAMERHGIGTDATVAGVCWPRGVESLEVLPVLYMGWGQLCAECPTLASCAPHRPQPC